MSEHPDTLEALNHLIAKADARHIAQVACLRDLIARGQSITEAMRTLVEIENNIIALNERWRSLLAADPK